MQTEAFFAIVPKLVVSKISLPSLPLSHRAVCLACFQEDPFVFHDEICHVPSLLLRKM